MKYLILLHHNPEIDAIWNGFSDEEKAEGWTFITGIVDELIEAGEFITTVGLAKPALGKRVTSTEDGVVTATDGPFAETKEYLAGLFYVDVASEERAIEIAAKFPESGFGLAEVRPTFEAGSLDL